MDPGKAFSYLWGMRQDKTDKQKPAARWQFGMRKYRLVVQEFWDRNLWRWGEYPGVVMLLHWPSFTYFLRPLLWTSMREIILSSAGIHLIQCDSSYIYILSNFLMCVITPGLKHIYLKPTSHSLPHHQISQEALTMQRGNPQQCKHSAQG